MSKPRERVAELESRVAELEATVEGLTEELVERTERIRALEAEDSERTEADGGERPAETTTPAEEETETEASDDIIVA